MSLDALRQHYERFLGNAQGGDMSRPIEVARWARPEFATAATLGLSRERITVIYPQELVCSVRPDQADAAQFLVHKTLDVISGAGQGMVHQSVITNDEPLLPDTDIHGVLVSAHPYLDDAFNVVFGPGRTVLVDIMTLVPITSAEAAFARGGNVERLLDAIEAADPDLTDTTRRSVV